MTRSDQHVLNYIRCWVWSGFYSEDEIQRMLDDVLDEDCNVAMLRSSITPEMARKLAAEVTWPDPTDCDKLDSVFYDLHEQGICALANCGNEMSDEPPRLSRRLLRLRMEPR